MDTEETVKNTIWEEKDGELIKKPILVLTIIDNVIVGIFKTDNWGWLEHLSDIKMTVKFPTNFYFFGKFIRVNSYESYAKMYTYVELPKKLMKVHVDPSLFTEIPYPVI